MLGHYLAAALAAHRRRPAATVLGVTTLALGLTAFLGAYGIAGYWDRADQHFANADRTFVVTSQWRVREVEEGAAFGSGVLPRTAAVLAEHLREDFPAIEAVARLAPFQTQAYQTHVPVRAAERAVHLRSLAADAEFLDILELPFAAGDPETALQAPRGVVLTQDAARRLFGAEPALGRSIMLDRWEATVTGVLAPIPEPSHLGASPGAPLRFDLLAAWDIAAVALRERYGTDAPQVVRDWANQSTTTYVLLPADGSLPFAQLRAMLPAFTERHVPPEQGAVMLFELDLAPVGDLLGLAIDRSLFLQQSGVSAAAALLLLGGLVLAVACVNFANLAVARAARRARAIGMRKVLGASTRHVFAQHLLETGMLTAAALGVALALLAAATPALERAAGIDLRLALFAGPQAWAALGATLAAVTLAAGAYPAIVLARVPGCAVLRSMRPHSRAGGTSSWLVGAQFSIAAFLLIGVAVTYSQNRLLERTGLGLTEAPLLVLENDAEISGLAHATLREEMQRLPQVIAATQLTTAPWTVQAGTMPLTTSADDQAVARTALLQIVGPNFFTTFEIPLLAGRDFNPDRAEEVAAVGGPPTGTQSVVVSRSLARDLGFAAPSEAIGELIYMPRPADDPGRALRIIGVVEDKPINISTGFGAMPGVYLFNPERRFHVVKIDPRDIAGALAAIDALWARLVPDIAISRRFVDAYFNDAYAQFARVSQVFTALALAAALIAATGLFAMALLAVNRRVHEIGVRKTLGASEGQVLGMLLASFTWPVVVANAVAWPLAYMATRAYLDLFIQPIELTWRPFAGCLAATVLVAWLAVVGQTWRAARAEPASVLRHE